MTRTRSLALLPFVTLVACAQTVAPLPPPPTGLKRVAVEQPVNRTGSTLVVDGPGAVERVLKFETLTVPEILAEDLRAALTQQGFSVVQSGGKNVAILRTEISRWEPYSADYSTLTVDIVATLVEPDGGRELWRVTRAGWVIPTAAARSRPEASKEASVAIAEALLEGWQPSAPPPSR